MDARQRTLTWVVWVVGGVLAVPVLLFGAFAAINWRDVPPSAAARALQATLDARAPVADADNAWLDALGLAAPAGIAPQTLGRQRRDWLVARQARPQDGGGWQFPGDDIDTRPAPGTPAHALLQACRTWDAACGASLRSARADWQAQVQARSTELARYRDMQSRRGWREVALRDARAPVTPLQHALEAQRLHLVDAWLHADGGDARAATALLEADGRFWRTVLASADHLITKMLAATALRRHAHASAMVLSRLPADAIGPAMPASLAGPLTLPERSLRRALAGEWVLLQAMALSMPQSSADARPPVIHRPASLVFKPQDTINRQAALFLRMAKASEAPPAGVLEAIERARADTAQDGTRAWRWAYNPSGRLLSDIATPAYEGYARRLAEVDSARAAAQAVIALHAARVPPESVAHALRTGPWRDPVQAAPLSWDGAGGCVRYGRDAAAVHEPGCIVY